MAYTPLNWQSGDIVTAEKLNQMKGGVLFITPTEIGVGTVSLGYSYNDIVAMIENNIFPMLSVEVNGVHSFERLSAYEEYEGTYTVYMGEDFTAQSATDILTAVTEDPLL